MKTYRATDIVYDTDGSDVDLPSEMEVELEDDVDPSLELADAVSDRTGWLVESLSFEEVLQNRPGM